MRIGHTHPRAVLVMYFWSALVSFGVVAYSVVRKVEQSLRSSCSRPTT